MRFFSKVRLPQVKYHSLRLSEEESLAEDDKYLLQEHQSRVRSHLSGWYLAILYIALAALAVATITTSTLYLQLLHRHAPRRQLTCGTSVAEARKAGCTFDRLTKAWLPAECPRYYEDEYIQFPSTLNMTDITGWHYWEDRTTTKEITDQEMALFAETRPLHDMSWVSTNRMHLAQ
jgi:hypothetical protein